MRRYILRRTFQNVFLLWALITTMFFLFRLLPGDPVATTISAELTEEARLQLRADWGLDQPLSVQYISYFRNLLAGDFGLSFYHQEPVWGVLSEKLVNTLVLMIPATMFGTILGAVIGMYFGWRRGSRMERIGVLIPPIIRGMPVFWLGVLLLMGFSYTFRIFPNGGMRTIGVPPSGWVDTFVSMDFLWHLILPMACTVITSLPEPMLIMRSSMLETIGEDFLELVEAKGVKETVILRHAARNSMLPVMTWIFHMFGYAIASTVLIEVVFAWPGIGRELVTAVDNLDFPMAQAAFFLISIIIISMNFILDLVYGILDPRVVLE